MTPQEKYNAFTQDLLSINSDFKKNNYRASSMKNLLDEMESQIKKNAVVAFADETAAVNTCANPQDSRITKYRPAIGRLVQAWGKAGRYPYAKVQFMGYCVNAAPKRVVDKKDYLGLDDEKKDVEARVALLARAIDKAYGEADKSAITLKVFVVPEFFFRGKKGAYAMTPESAPLHAVEKLQAMTADDKYKNWIFFFGSILGTFSLTKGSGQEPPKPPTIKDLTTLSIEAYTLKLKQYKEAKVRDVEVDKSAKAVVYNVVLTQKGGTGLVKTETSSDNQGKTYKKTWNTGAFVTMKEYKSTIDFIDRVTRKDTTAYALEDVEHIDLGGTRPTGPGKEQSKPEGGDGVFEIDGVTIGVEICLDHWKKRLRESPQASGQKKIQLQIVPSAGMSVEAKGSVAMKGGYVFNCDGLNTKSGKKGSRSHTELRKVKTMYNGGTNAVLFDHAKSDASTAIPIAVQPVSGANLSVSGSTVKIDELFAIDAGEVHVYGPVDLPDPENMP